MDIKTLLSDPRRRNLAALFALALISCVWAAIALEMQAAEVAPVYAPHTFLQGFAGESSHATRIHIVSKKSGVFDVVFKPQKGWVLPARGDYPASFEQVRKTLVGLAALETIEPKTARPDWLHYIDLDAPPGGNGTLIEVGDDQGRVLASLIVGKSEDIGDPSGATGLFVRKPGEDQSWLVRSVVVPPSTIGEWMNKAVATVDPSRIQEADFTPPGGPPFTLAKAKQSDLDFALASVPRGREAGDPGTLDGAAQALGAFAFDDVRQASDLDFDHGTSRLVTKTFDGLIVTVDVLKQGDDLWARLFAASQPGHPDADKEASQINAHAAGWAFKLTPYVGSQFATSLDSLLKPVGAKTK
jgi:hypothetical protein